MYYDYKTKSYCILDWLWEKQNHCGQQAIKQTVKLQVIFRDVNQT